MRQSASSVAAVRNFAIFVLLFCVLVISFLLRCSDGGLSVGLREAPANESRGQDVREQQEREGELPPESRV